MGFFLTGEKKVSRQNELVKRQKSPRTSSKPCNPAQIRAVCGCTIPGVECWPDCAWQSDTSLLKRGREKPLSWCIAAPCLPRCWQEEHGGKPAGSAVHPNALTSSGDTSYLPGDQAAPHIFILYNANMHKISACSKFAKLTFQILSNRWVLNICIV